MISFDHTIYKVLQEFTQRACIPPPPPPGPGPLPHREGTVYIVVGTIRVQS